MFRNSRGDATGGTSATGETGEIGPQHPQTARGRRNRQGTAYITALSDADADVCIQRWAAEFSIGQPLRRERISVWQVTNEQGRPGCGLVGVYHDDAGACILHTRRLTTEDIVHELLHVAHPEWSETSVVAETAAHQRHRLTQGSRAPQRATVCALVHSERFPEISKSPVAKESRNGL